MPDRGGQFDSEPDLGQQLGGTSRHSPARKGGDERVQVVVMNGYCSVSVMRCQDGGGDCPLKPLEALNTTPQGRDPWHATQGEGCLAVNAIASATRCSVAHQSGRPVIPSSQNCRHGCRTGHKLACAAGG